MARPRANVKAACRIAPRQRGTRYASATRNCAAGPRGNVVDWMNGIAKVMT
jgi:hypothetical protein